MLLEKKGKEKGESKRGGVGEVYFLAKGWLTVTCRVQGAEGWQHLFLIAILGIR
jgi:hypothetical protein